jgi:hypothetical protein
VDLYIHSPIRLHGVVLNYLSTGTTSPYVIFIIFPYYLRCSAENNSRFCIHWLCSNIGVTDGGRLSLCRRRHRRSSAVLICLYNEEGKVK